MRVVAYTFDADESAQSARKQLIRTFDMAAEDVVVAPVADGGVVVAVRTGEENLRAVRALLEQHGGRHATDIPEAWVLAD